MDLKIVFLIILGIITSILICKIVHQEMYIAEGFFDFGTGLSDFVDNVKRTINQIVTGVNIIICFVEYLIELLKWSSHTILCIFHFFMPPCPIFYIIDMLIAFVGWILGELLKLVHLEMLIEAFSMGCDGINFITNATLGVEITDFHAWMGIKPLCYDPAFEIKPFPEFIVPKKNDWI